MDKLEVPWEDVAKRFQDRRAASFPVRWLVPQDELNQASHAITRVADLLPKWLSDEEIRITELGASALAAKIRDGEWTSLQITEAFCHRATIAHQLTNCLTEVFFDEALESARRLDEHLKSTGKPLGPLHGVPVSVKDHYNVKGQYTTAGYISYSRFPVREKDAHIVEIIRNAGAVLYAKTNNPQCMMVLETVSNIYGRTLNPLNTRVGAGGSSGGEGALLASHASPLGVGSDVGGSIRIPAAFNGLYGFKPSGKRVPTAGWECTMTGSESIIAVAGPLGHCVEDLELFFQVVSNAKPWLKEPLLGFPWLSQPEPEPSKLTVVVDFKSFEHKRAWDEILLPLYFTDGGLDIKQTLDAGNEPMFPSAKRLISDPIVKERSIHEIWKLNIDRDIYKMDYLQKWNATSQTTRSGKPIDVLICPVASVQGTPHDVKPWWGYCSQWNLLDYPSGVIPVSRVLDSDAHPQNYQPVNELDRENMELYDIDLYRDMPVALQIVGLTHEDEKVMAAMKTIDRIANQEK